MKFRNSLKILIARTIDNALRPFWDFFYSFESNRERFEYSCFPFPLKVNCIGCHGCSENQNPPLRPERPKGPYKIYTGPLFDKDYKELFGEGALVQLWANLDQHNKEVDRQNEEEKNRAQTSGPH